MEQAEGRSTRKHLGPAVMPEDSKRLCYLVSPSTESQCSSSTDTEEG